MVRFIADGMLGSFTRWLRILGCEVKYLNEASDETLLEVAEKEGRVLLTRDLELFQRARTRGLEALFIKGETKPEKMVEVARRYKIPLEVDLSISRCPTCGFRIRRVEKSEVFDKIPKGTFTRYSEFWLCAGCGKVYWQGSHWEKINETLEKAKKLLVEKNGSRNQLR